MAVRLLPVLLWTCVIASFSREAWSSSGTGFLGPILTAAAPWLAPEQVKAVVWLVRKMAHFTEYAVLAGLWRWTLLPRRRATWIALGLSVLTAALDEAHQATTVTRTGSVADVLLDSVGAASALALLSCGTTAIDRLIGALLWIAALGGAALIAINWLAAAPAPWLWPSVPLAWLALVLWRRRPPAPA